MVRKIRWMVFFYQGLIRFLLGLIGLYQGLIVFLPGLIRFYQGLIGLLPGADLQVIMQLYKRGLREGALSLIPRPFHREDLQSTLQAGPHCFKGIHFQL